MGKATLIVNNCKTFLHVVSFTFLLFISMTF